MANRSFQRLESLDRNEVELAFSFAFNGTSAIAATSIKGMGMATVVRDGVGEITVTLSDKYSKLVGAGSNVQLAAVAPIFMQLGAVDLSAKTIKLHVLNATVASDVAANANNRANVILRLKK